MAMVRDATRNVGADDRRFTYEVMDAHRLYKPDASYDCSDSRPCTVLL